MGWADDQAVDQFFKDVAWLEPSLQAAGVTLVKYWFSVSDREQEQRFKGRIETAAKNFKLSPTLEPALSPLLTGRNWRQPST